MYSKRILAASFSVLLLGDLAVSCTFAPRFYQVTKLKGRIVGKNLGRPLQYIRFLRQAFSVGGAELSLYREQSNLEGKPVAITRADNGGNFDFGKIEDGRYSLLIRSPRYPDKYSDLYNVEVKNGIKETERVIIDISHFFPDCKGGHEFIVKNKT